MTYPRMPVEIGKIRGLMIIVGDSPKAGHYRLRAESSNFRDWYEVGSWDTIDEAVEEFQKWDTLRKTQMEENE